MDLNGYLLVDKLTGWTSHDVVAKIRNVLKKETGQKVKVGHAGTLDPAATGLLLILVGSYCKRAGEFSKLDKTYEAEIILGKVSTTGDSEGEITERSAEKPSKVQVEEAIKAFVGAIEQVPHKFSAMKVGGQRAYKLARAGKEVKMEPRQVTIHNIEDVQYDYPKLSFTTEVSSGTYIRSLAEDIGEKLSTGAYLSALRRTKIDKFNISDSVSIDENSKKFIINTHV